jgi:hypothetical protein
MSTLVAWYAVRLGELRMITRLMEEAPQSQNFRGHKQESFQLELEKYHGYYSVT